MEYVTSLLKYLILQDIAEYAGFKLTMIANSILMPLFVLISSFMLNFWLFALFFGAFFGMFAGFSYMLPVHVGYAHYPNRRYLFIFFVVK